MTANDKFIDITTDEMPRYIEMAWNTLQKTGFAPIILFEGPPGSGKTAMAHHAAKIIADKMGSTLVNQPTGALKQNEFGMWVTQFANSSEEVISGLPWVNKPIKKGDESTQERAMVRSFPRGGPGIWYCDEPLQAPYTQRFLAQLTYGGKLDDYYVLPKNVLIVMSGNSAKDRAGVSRMWSHFQNRVMLIRVNPTVEGALRHFRSPLQPEVAIYLRWFSSKLHNFDPKKDGPFPSARTWDFVNSMIFAGANPEDHFPVFQGYLGTSEAEEFKACFAAVRSLPDIDAVLADPHKHQDWIKKSWKSNNNLITALSFLMLRKLRDHRDVALAAKAIAVFEIAGPEQAQAYISIAKDMEDQIGDGLSVLDSQEYRDFVVRNPRLTLE